MNEKLQDGEFMFAFLDDIYVVSQPDRGSLLLLSNATLASKCIWENPKFGMQLDESPQAPRQFTRMRGLEAKRSGLKGSSSSGPQWEPKLLLTFGWKNELRSSSFSWSASRKYKTLNALFSSFSSVQGRERITR